jgi:hypothetical protein
MSSPKTARTIAALAITPRIVTGDLQRPLCKIDGLETRYLKIFGPESGN